MLIKRLAIRVEGTVQGVGFRPFVYGIAFALKLAGWVLNDSEGVLIEVEGSRTSIDLFVVKLEKEIPPLASISRMIMTDLTVLNEVGFRIVESQHSSQNTAQIPPDTYVCPDCLG